MDQWIQDKQKVMSFSFQEKCSLRKREQLAFIFIYNLRPSINTSHLIIIYLKNCLAFKEAMNSRFDIYLTKKNPKVETSVHNPNTFNSKHQENTHHVGHLQKITNYPQVQRTQPKALSPVIQNNPSSSSILYEYKPKIKVSHQIKSQDTSQIIKKIVEAQKPIRYEPLQISPQLVLIGPFDLANYIDQQQKLEELTSGCNKVAVIQWIKSKNLAKNSPVDYSNIQKITDQDFWCEDIQSIIIKLLKQQSLYNSCIKMLPQLDSTQEITLQRQQIFLLIASMFLCIIPPQMDNSTVSFVELMALRPIDSKYPAKAVVRLEKLKCVVNYLKFMNKNEEIFMENVVIRRVYSKNSFTESKPDTPLSKVTIEMGKIESGYGRGIIIDFANANIGGGFLTNGSAQQEILFSTFPEMIIVKLLCASLRDEEAIVVRGARKINNYEGYSANFKFNGTNFSDTSFPSDSCIVAVDALDFSNVLLPKPMQYSQKLIKRQLHKIHLGIKAALQMLDQQDCEVFTGRWGCGVFGADQCLKFCIQWIVCSQAGVPMRFFVDNIVTVKKLSFLVEELQQNSTFDLLSLIEDYGKGNRDCTERGFLQYLKYCA